MSLFKDNPFYDKIGQRNKTLGGQKTVVHLVISKGVVSLDGSRPPPTLQFK